jgi:DNA repair protein RadC
MTEALNIKAWAEADRPREKLLQQGKHSLTDCELLAILIRSGSRQETAVELSRRILNASANDLSELSRLSVKDLSKYKGMGSVKAISIVAALELGRRRREAEALKKNKIGASSDVALIFQPALADLTYEEFWVLMLDRANQVISKFNLSKGGTSGTVVDPKIIFKTAIEHNASGIILCHNHPSGNSKPSEADLKLTKNLKASGDMLEIKVLDHIIIAGSSYLSFADEGLM